MGKRERYEPGTFCWVDLATTDPAGARTFYGELFGWDAEEAPEGEAWGYAMMSLDCDVVCGVYELEAERREVGVPPHWFNCVSVEDADAVADRANLLGGDSLGGAFDVQGLGRMAVLQDPAGAVLGAWQPGSHVGATRVNDVGCMTWNELHTREPERMAAFYAELFRWEMEAQTEDGTLAYVVIKNAGNSNGGIMPMTEQHGDAPPFWLPYFTVPSCDDAVAKTRERDGDLLAGSMDLEAGRIAVLTDPQGAAFAVFEGETDD